MSDHKHHIRKCSAQAEGVLNSGRVRESGHFMKAINKRFKIHTNNPPKKLKKGGRRNFYISKTYTLNP